jgi:3-hydroxyacyl-CoA dehydrogenase
VREIHKVAILGAGTMGARIAAHLANASIPSVLLDIAPEGASPDDPKARNRIAPRACNSLIQRWARVVGGVSWCNDRAAR